MTSQTTHHPTTIYLVRHGESQWNLEKRVSGQSDPPLSLEGIRQSDLLANQLRDARLTAIYTSALQRTVETARATAEHHQLPIQCAARLNELHMGVLEGRFRDARDPKASAIWKAHKSDKRHCRIPGGERFIDLMERVTTWLSDMLTHENGGQILIVGHRNVNRILFGLLMCRPEDEWPHLELKSRCLYRIRTGAQPKVDSVDFMTPCNRDKGTMTTSMV